MLTKATSTRFYWRGVWFDVRNEIRQTKSSLVSAIGAVLKVKRLNVSTTHLMSYPPIYYCHYSWFACITITIHIQNGVVGCCIYISFSKYFRNCSTFWAELPHKKNTRTPRRWPDVTVFELMNTGCHLPWLFCHQQIKVINIVMNNQQLDVINNLIQPTIVLIIWLNRQFDVINDLILSTIYQKYVIKNLM